MSDPKRLHEGDGPGALLLGAARDDAPSAESFERAAKRLGLVGAVVATSTLGSATAAGATAANAGAATGSIGAAAGTGLGAAAASTGAVAGGSLIAKIVGVAVVGVAIGTGVVVAARAPAAPLVAPPVASAGPLPSPVVVTPPSAIALAAEVASVEPAPEPTKPEKPSAPPKTSADSALRDELALLDSARGAIARGDTAAALAALGQHGQRFPRGYLGSEAAVLRVEALVKAGRRAEADAEGDRLLAREPNGPQAQRVRSLLGR